MFDISPFIKKGISVDNLLIEQDKSLTNNYNPSARSRGVRFYNLMKMLIHGILIKCRLWKRLIYSNLNLNWFYEFKEYCEKELGFRNIEVNDYWFLYGIFRLEQAAAEYYSNSRNK